MDFLAPALLTAAVGYALLLPLIWICEKGNR